MGTELAVIGESGERIPAQITPATQAGRMNAMVSTAQKIISERHVHNIQGKQYVDVAGLTYMAFLLGLTVASGEPERVEIDGVKAFRVRAEVLYDGRMVSSGYGIVADDESTWRNRPIFAKAAMAGTRAAGRALRMMLSPAVVSMGYEATPMEEMPRDDDGGKAPSRQVENTAKSEQVKSESTAAMEWKDDRASITQNTPRACGKVVSVAVKKEGERNGKPWKLFGITLKDDDAHEIVLDTFSESAADVAANARENNEEVSARFDEKQNGRFTNRTLLSIAIVEF